MSYCSFFLLLKIVTHCTIDNRLVSTQKWHAPLPKIVAVENWRPITNIHIALTIIPTLDTSTQPQSTINYSH